MSALAVNPSLDFNALKALLNLTDGNLASHLKALEKAGFVGVEKAFVGRKPNTKYSITSLGRTEFEYHLQVLEQLIKSNK